MNLKYGPYSNSRRNLCPERRRRRYIDKEEGIRSPLAGTNEGIAAHELFDMFIKGGVANVHEFLVKKPEFARFESQLTEALIKFESRFNFNREFMIGSEQRVAILEDMSGTSFFDKSAWYRGIIDYLEIDENMHARIVDFKNYPIVHNEADISDIYDKHSIGSQLMGYAAQVFATYPGIESAELEVYYIRYGTSRKVSIKEDGEWKTRIILREDAEAWWESCKRDILSIEESEDFHPEPSTKNCQYCEYTHSCSYLNSGAADKPLITLDDAKASLSSMVVMDEQRKRIRARVSEYAKLNGPIELDSGQVYGPVEVVDVDFDLEALSAILDKEDFNGIVSVSKTALKRLLKKKPELAEDISKTEIHTVKTRIK